jgi:glutathione synthase/RimK-type ligase-like ATP-grasp enzyme
VDAGATVGGVLKTPELAVDLDSVRAAYLRSYDWRRIPAVRRAGPGSSLWLHALELEGALSCWSDLSSALVVNRPAAMASNNSKPYQALLIQALGFAVPDTMVTTDPDAVLAFWQRHGTVVYKSNSGIRSIVSRLTDAHRERLGDVTSCPTQFQQYIPGVDVRVHVVGDQIFASEVRPLCGEDACDDYRYAVRDGVQITISPSILPDDVAERCRALATGLGLSLAGIDLRRTPTDEWFCFEVNPSPAFTFYQEATQQPIAEAVATLLAAGCRSDAARTSPHGRNAHPAPVGEHTPRLL